jgi:squamous cell carcinoma antigen recognized by T-cells 3
MGEPVGEDSWMSLVDESSRAAGDLEQRVEVVELYKRAVGAEPFSLRLWFAYCEWIWSLYTDCQSGDAGWSEEEQLLGQELFSLDMALDVWQQGAQATRYRLHDSHLLWNRWISIELEELAKDPETAAIERIKALFLDRLQIPHATWDETSQSFSTFLTKYDESAWEKTMVTVTQIAKTAKDLYSQREIHELKLQRCSTSGDKGAQEGAMIEYLGWEVGQSSKKNGSRPLLFALYERALLLLPTNSNIWEDYVVSVTTPIFNAGSKKGKVAPVPSDLSTTPNILTILQRATKHCPWSGSLWSRYILGAETEGLSFSEVEQIKHAATGSGQLDRNGMTDVLAVYSAWCGFLRRCAVGENASDEDVDIADVGLSSALESFQEWGERLYGQKVYKGDPTFRLEQCLIQYLTQRGHISEARSQWQKLVKSHGDSYEFWQRYYLWEMSVDHVKSTRPLATALLRQAVARRGLDWPEKIMEVYLHHCETYETPQILVEAVDHLHIISKDVAKRRQREAADAANTYTAQQVYQAEPATAESATEMSPSGASKRKRDSVSDVDGIQSKKLKGEVDVNEIEASQHLKRDRENTTVLVTNLPPDITQTKIRQYFKEYGHINNLTVKAEEDGLSSAALIEFRTPEDVQSAMIKDGKYISDKQIHVKTGTGLTLYVTNYPPTADEAYMRELFAECGDIFSIRWPSLKYNTHRRFCYISFRSASAAAAATQLDGKLLEGRYKLEAKYSDPSKKKTREGAGAEGREIHIANIDRSATEDDLREIFSKYGCVESVRILKNVAGRSKGGGFIVFEKMEEAKDALALDKTKFKSQILTVELSTQSNYKPSATTIGSKASSTPPVPDSEGDLRMSNSPAPHSPAASTQDQHDPSRAEIAARTIAVMNIPDTVNDARIRAIADPFGTIVKLTLRPDHQGAIIEYSDVPAAGRASLGLENREIVPGRKLRTGRVRDLFQEKAEIRIDRIQTGIGAKKPPPSTGSGFIQPTMPVRRPGSGVRGGLGTKRGLGYASALSKKEPGEGHANENGTSIDDEKKVQPKSNADFKAMFLKGEGQ